MKDGFLESFDPELKRAFDFAKQRLPEGVVDYAAIKMRKDSLKLSGDGTFYTLQGEGPTTGLPCVFVRLHVCNLRCTWCDAWYTWNPNTEEFWTEGRDISFEEAAKLIRETWEGPDHIQKRVIWTGGEPLIQRKQIDQVMRLLNPASLREGQEDCWFPGRWEAEFETNGTLMPTRSQLAHVQFNCSPKLANSDNQHHSMVKPKVLEALNKANTTFKFVCLSETDLDEIEEKYLPHIDHSKVIIMPQGITEEEVSMNAKILAEPCKQRGYRLMGRLQNILWDGARRGV